MDDQQPLLSDSDYNCDPSNPETSTGDTSTSSVASTSNPETITLPRDTSTSSNASPSDPGPIPKNTSSSSVASSSSRLSRCSLDSGLGSDNGDNVTSNSDMPQPPEGKNPLSPIPENNKVEQDKETSSSTEEVSRALPSPGDSDGSSRSRTRSLPAADLLRPGAKNLRQRRQGKAITFTSCVDRDSSSNLTTIKDEQSQSEYECKPMTGIFSPTSASTLELLNQTKKTDTASQTMPTDFIDSITPAEETIKDAIREHSHQFSKYMNLTQLAMHLEKHMLLDKDSRSKLLDPNSTVSIALRPHYFLFEVLPSKGSSAYTLFLRALEEEQEHLGHKELVSLIRKHSMP